MGKIFLIVVIAFLSGCAGKRLAPSREIAVVSLLSGPDYPNYIYHIGGDGELVVYKEVYKKGREGIRVQMPELSGEILPKLIERAYEELMSAPEGAIVLDAQVIKINVSGKIVQRSSYQPTISDLPYCSHLVRILRLQLPQSFVE